MANPQATSAAVITRAIEVFVRGFSFTRSFTHPFIPQRVGSLWVVRDGPRKSGDYRTEEWIARDMPPAEIDRIVRAESRGPFAVCAFCDISKSDTELRAGFKQIGYRLVRTEPLMTHDLKKTPRFNSPAKIEHILTQELAEQLGKASRSRPTKTEFLKKDAPLRQYVALVDGNVVGWVRSISVGDATWCSSMYVSPPFRRQGIGRAMLSRMLRDDRARGAKQAVLLASHTGALLYPVVGYRQIATLLLFVPKK